MPQKIRPVVVALACVVTFAITAVPGGLLGSTAHAAQMTTWTKYHNAAYDYTLTYPTTWRIHTQLSSVILDSGAAGPCQVDVQVDDLALAPQKALAQAVRPDASHIVYGSIGGAPSVSYHWTSQPTLTPGAMSIDAIHDDTIVAQAAGPQASRVYTLTLIVYRALPSYTPAVQVNCETTFRHITASLVLAAHPSQTPQPAVLTNPGNPAVAYADGTTVDGTDYNYQLTKWDASYGRYCDGNGYNLSTLDCWVTPNPPTARTAKKGYYQPDFQCAEFVARALAAEGLILGLSAYNNRPGDYWYHYARTNQNYELRNVGTERYDNNHNYLSGILGLHDFLIDSGLGVDIGDNPQLAVPGDVAFYYNGTPNQLDGSNREHVGLLVQTGPNPADNLVDFHNTADQDVPYQAPPFPGRSIVHLNVTGTQRMGALDSGGNFWVGDGAVGTQMTLVYGPALGLGLPRVIAIALSGTRMGLLDANGYFRVADGPIGSPFNFNVATGPGITAIALAGNRMAAIDGNTWMIVNDGPVGSSFHSAIGPNIKAIALSGSRMAAIDGWNNMIVGDGSAGTGFNRAVGPISAIAVSGTRMGAIDTWGNMIVNDGPVGSSFSLAVGAGISAIALSGSRMAAIDGNHNFIVNDGAVGTSFPLATGPGISAIALAGTHMGGIDGNRMGGIDGNHNFIVNDGSVGSSFGVAAPPTIVAIALPTW
jgi:hypothetical protein